VDRVEVSTVVHLPPREIYDFLVDFPRYARYSKYLESVDQYGDGTPGTEYDLNFAWWKLSYTARSEVIEANPPEGLSWRLTKDITARGDWTVERIDPPEGVDDACRVRLTVRFDPDSADSGTIDLPRFVSLSWVVEKVKPKIQTEAERVVERIVADLEGGPRDVDLEIHTVDTDV
jgi:uncharacterized membrane protein